MASRDNEVSSRIDEQATANESMAARLADLEARQADKSDPNEPARRVRSGETRGEQRDKEPADRPRMSNEFVAVGVAVGGGALTLAGMVLGTTAAVDATGLAISAIGIGGAGLPWIRKLREGRNADRPED